MGDSARRSGSCHTPGRLPLPFWEIRARQGEARAWLSQALALNGAVPPSFRAKALIAAGRATAWQGDLRASIALLEEAAELSRQLGDLEGVRSLPRFYRSWIAVHGDAERAAAVLDEAVDLARNTGEPHSLARAIYNSAFAAVEQRDFDRACELFEESALIGRLEGTKLHEAMCLVHLGYTSALAGDYERAAALLDKGVALFTELGETTWTQVAFRYQGLLALLDGRIDEADPLLRTSLMKGREQAPQWEVAHWIESLLRSRQRKAKPCGPRSFGERPMLCSGSSGLRFSKRIVRYVNGSETMYKNHATATRGRLGRKGTP